MLLRKLQLKDAPLMLEWMHDDDVTHDLNTDFASKKMSDAEAFILASADRSEDLDLAIVSDTDEYMGTVSLKHIDKTLGNAEFAITVRKDAMGRGYPWFGMSEIIRIAFEELGLDCVYWCVSKKNQRAIKFYNKHGFNQVVDISENILDRYKGKEDLIWYSVLRNDNYKNQALDSVSVAGCKVVRLKPLSTENAGELYYFEANHDINFEIKRIYYISKVPEGVRRGFHAHKTLKQFLFCPYGKIQLIVTDGKHKEEITLSDPSIGVIIDRPIWREMLWMEKNSVLCVAASDYYEADDYIRNYDQFKEYIEGVK